MKPYYEDEQVTLYHGDCREVTDWLAADVLVTDPPYGRNWRQGRLSAKHHADNSRAGIANDVDTTARDDALNTWGARSAIVFGDFMLEPPNGTKQVLVYAKPTNAGVRGATAGFQRDTEAIYIMHGWPSGIGGESSILRTAARSQGNPFGLSGRYEHPHAKPVDVMERLVGKCPAGVITDPFAGSGSTLIAARNLGRKAIGVEIEERYCEIAAKRLAQDVLPLEAS